MRELFEGLNTTPIMKEAIKKDGLQIKREFISSPITEQDGIWQVYTCEIEEQDGNNYSMTLYGADPKQLEDMRDRVMFGLNEADKLKAELAEAQRKIKELERILKH